MDSFWLIAIIINLVLSGVVAYAANQKGRSGPAFFVLSFFLSFIVGILVVLALPAVGDSVTSPTAARVACPHCQEQILAAANVCKHCGRDVPPNTGALTAAAEVASELQQQSVRNRRTAGILQGSFIIFAGLVLALVWPSPLILIVCVVVLALGIFWLVRTLRVPKVAPTL